MTLLYGHIDKVPKQEHLDVIQNVFAENSYKYQVEYQKSAFNNAGDLNIFDLCEK